MIVARLIINWFMLITSPVWCLPFFVFMVVEGRKDNSTRGIFIEGKKWFWT